MATYYPSSNSQVDVLSAPYTQDQKFTSYPESNLLHGNMMMYLNPTSSNGNYSEISSGSSLNHHNGENFSSMSGRNEMMFIPPTGDPMSMPAISGPLNSETVENVGNSFPGELQLTSRNHLSIMDGEQNLQGLSLSLSTQMSTAISTPSFQYQYSNPGISSVLSPHLPLSTENSVRQMACKVDETSPSKDMRNSDYYPYDIHGDGNNTIRFGMPNNNPPFSMNPKGVNCNQYQYEQAGIASVLLKSKYLKAAQQLLDEVVNVREAIKRHESGKDQVSNKADEGSKESRGGSQPPSETNDSGVGSSSVQELSSSERQELQNKLDKLHSLLDEVDRRYKQYCHQMQVLVSSLDVVAGCGAAKPYTALALKTISRHFRCLRDAITGQIQATRKSLGEPDNGMGAAIPRLRYVDQKLRQQRALQQFGMMRHAWRPQRGLPESAVTILRAWLFEHFLHPYPKDSEKIMLARQTGLTRSQVANWFINARVRLWKPMVEEMYKEEFGDAEINCSEDNNTLKLAREKSWGSEDRRDEMLESSTSMVHDAHDSKANINHNPEMNGHSSSNSGLHINTLENNGLNHGFYNNGTISTDLNGGGHLMIASGAYPMSELGNFRVDNQVSLALGLRQREGDNIPPFRGNTNAETTMEVGMSEYPYMEQVNQQHNRFGNPHILNDFVS
ncbi:hypothetical protein RND81_06G057600 [Saponaria officinalis]|uniref:Homeobox domain-containing protein n=1 Tax=Saponaria officinalis TaxID=3572 RepID=A0AAW1K8E1_SAPOF